MAKKVMNVFNQQDTTSLSFSFMSTIKIIPNLNWPLLYCIDKLYCISSLINQFNNHMQQQHHLAQSHQSASSGDKESTQKESSHHSEPHVALTMTNQTAFQVQGAQKLYHQVIGGPQIFPSLAPKNSSFVPQIIGSSCSGNNQQSNLTTVYLQNRGVITELKENVKDSELNRQQSLNFTTQVEAIKGSHMAPQTKVTFNPQYSLNGYVPQAAPTHSFYQPKVIHQPQAFSFRKTAFPNHHQYVNNQYVQVSQLQNPLHNHYSWRDSDQVINRHRGDHFQMSSPNILPIQIGQQMPLSTPLSSYHTVKQGEQEQMLQRQGEYAMMGENPNKLTRIEIIYCDPATCKGHPEAQIVLQEDLSIQNQNQSASLNDVHFIEPQKTQSAFPNKKEDIRPECIEKQIYLGAPSTTQVPTANLAQSLVINDIQNSIIQSQLSLRQQPLQVTCDLNQKKQDDLCLDDGEKTDHRSQSAQPNDLNQFGNLQSAIAADTISTLPNVDNSKQNYPFNQQTHVEFNAKNDGHGFASQERNICGKATDLEDTKQRKEGVLSRGGFAVKIEKFKNQSESQSINCQDNSSDKRSQEVHYSKLNHQKDTTQVLEGTPSADQDSLACLGKRLAPEKVERKALDIIEASSQSGEEDALFYQEQQQSDGRLLKATEILGKILSTSIPPVRNSYGASDIGDYSRNNPRASKRGGCIGLSERELPPIETDFGLVKQYNRKAKNKINCDTSIVNKVELVNHYQINGAQNTSEKRNVGLGEKGQKRDPLKKRERKYLEYECQLVKVHKDRLKAVSSKSKGKKSSEDVNDEQLAQDEQERQNILDQQEKVFQQIIFQSNIQQLETLVNQTDEELEGEDPVLIHGIESTQSDKIPQYLEKVKKEQRKPPRFFRGVQLNGRKWQVLVMGNNCKYFSGSIPYQRLAARIYDRFAFQHFGLRAKVNLNYTKSQLAHVLKEIEEQVEDQQRLNDAIESGAANKGPPPGENLDPLHPTDIIVLKGSMPLEDI
ncbi:hypothetical protein FGO68_gene1721 [Halteria grandinella]|uniref:AP2/ERF domain-containing protein n=1 Tax=Halteria grandinella TaxID=5974 RepID=A0A8J8T6Y5_HALGN|nr:hypothetical protein FGO68_gene1721 [Halteria grandinella]